MKEKLLDILAIFVEKYLIQTVLTVIMAFLTYYKVPSDNPMLIKFSTIGFSVFVFCVWFIIIEIIKIIWNSIRRKSSEIHRDAYYSKENQAKTEKVLEMFWNRIDAMDPRDYRLLIEFIKNGNKPHYEAGFICGESLLTSDWVYRNQLDLSEKVIIDTEMNVSDGKGGFHIKPTTFIAKYQYKLKDDIYHILKYSYEKYGRISHFERE